MGCVFGQHEEVPNSRVNKDDKAIAELKITRDKVKNYLKKLESNILSLKSAIKDCIRSKQKEKAMILLRKQKYIEKNVSTGQGELLNLESLIVNVENAQIQKNVYEALKQGNDYLKSMNQQLTLDDVDKLMEETAEAIEYQQKIGEALSQQGIQENDSDLLEQLDQLDELEALDVDLPSVPISNSSKTSEKVPVKSERVVNYA